MKKYFVYLVAFIALCFLIPVLFTKSFQKARETNIPQNEEVIPKVTYDYKKYKTVKLYHKKTKKIEELSLDEYLYGVVSAEMPASFEEEALKAQAVVARTFTLYKIVHNSKKHENADICDDSTCCQAWISKEDRLARWEENKRESNWKKIEQCVKETRGKIITYQKEPINAFFHANSGGTTELPVNVWGGDAFPYLQVIQTAGEEGYRQYASEVVFSRDELIEKLKTKYEDIQIDFENKESI